MIRFFRELSRKDIAVAGGKGCNLGEMFSRFPVPNGFVVTTKAYTLFVEMKKLQERMVEQLSSLAVDDHASLEQVSKELKKLILDEKMIEKVEEGVIRALEHLKGDSFAVRSSATAEDLITASFAGQQDTYLEVKKADVVKHVQKCWASLFTPRAIYYRHEKGIPHDIAMAVVVQEMVDADSAGVMFTIDPIRKKYILVEAAHGLGEQVVSGSVTPSSYMLDRDTLEIVERNVEYDIDEGLVKATARLGLEIEKHYGRPQDVEFAFKGKNVYILQSRAITTL